MSLVFSIVRIACVRVCAARLDAVVSMVVCQVQAAIWQKTFLRTQLRTLLTRAERFPWRYDEPAVLLTRACVSQTRFCEPGQVLGR